MEEEKKVLENTEEKQKNNAVEKNSEDMLLEKEIVITESDQLKEESEETNRDKETELKPEEPIKQQEKEKNQKKKNKSLIVVLMLAIIFLIFLSTIFALININNEKIIHGVYVGGIDISGLTEEEAKSKVNEIATKSLKEDILLTYKDYNTSITPEQIETNLKVEEAIKEARKIGKTNNIIIDNYTILKSNLLKTKIEIPIEYHQEVLQDIVKNINTELPGGLKEVSYEINKKKLIINNGKDGIVINDERLEDKIIKEIQLLNNSEKKIIEIPVKEQKAEKIDIEKIYKEVYKEAKDAYIQENPFELHVEEEGLDFEISMEEAKKIVSEEKETYTIPLKITKPKVKTADLGNKIFKQTLSKYTTIYDAGNTSRSTNIAIAARTINGKIILPGETFSYNGTLGNTSKDKGYQLGGAYVNGKVVPAYGGGICQVSSTLYNAALYANLEIVERYNHSYAVSYVPAGRDATVSYGGKDFKFKNTRSYPIKIEASGKNGVISVSLKGIKETKEYNIEITSKVLSTSPYETTYQNNDSLAEGKQKVIQVGHNGLKSKAYKIVSYNGKVISKTLLSADTYKPMNRIIEKGTKKVKTTKQTTKKEETKIEEAEVTENED